ncbi:hypothetical protein RDWZM_009948 [Blomia tropicalis]|uniref:SKP1 component POZ domain-containing protein n=1 Tax=Blomia tropicalis TaxID=40697 RepID=A0A9Q0LVV9_BLOTA|nr:hypothetical protein RDWZM_009948 [Blomia tropicalis]
MDYIMIQANDDNYVLMVEIETARMSKYIRCLIDYFKMGNGKIIIIHGIDRRVLANVFRWCEYHKNDPPSLACQILMSVKVIDPWDCDFLSMDNKSLYDLLVAAKCLGVSGLVNICCKILKIHVDDVRDNEFINLNGGDGQSHQILPGNHDDEAIPQ